jgi:aryl-alcohol dehydrogenase-like predicted oxidoreductase
MGIEDNLSTLGIERLAAVNLRLLDRAVPGPRFDAQVAALVQARDEGLIDGIGLSNISLAHLLATVAHTDVVCVQNLFNLTDRRSLDVLDECTVRGIAFVPFFPLGSPRAGQNAILSSPVLARLGQRLNATPVQLALAWLLDLAPNILLIPGTRTRGHLDENNRSASVHLDDDARAELAQHFPDPRAG